VIGIYAFLNSIISYHLDNALECLSEIFNDLKHCAVSLLQLSCLLYTPYILRPS